VCVAVSVAMRVAGVDSYRQHGCRLLFIWLHCQLLFGSDDRELSTQLVAAVHDINRKSLAGQTRLPRLSKRLENIMNSNA